MHPILCESSRARWRQSARSILTWGFAELARAHPEKALVTRRITEDMLARLHVLLDLGLGYLALERSTPTLSPGELQRLRLATQVR